MSEDNTTAVITAPGTKAKSGPVIEIKDLSKAFGELKVLSGFTADLMQGENLVVLGKSGSGKSVLIKCIVGLLTYDGGSITVMGQEVSSLGRKELDAMRQKVGFLFQSGALYDSMTVRENLMFPLSEEDQVQLGYIDTADYSEIETAMKADVKMPRIVLITDAGKNLYIYDDDAENLEGIQRFVREEYKKQEPLRIPKNTELINYSGFS
jgi:ABC-type sugar transport system ATPase subunit